MKNPFSQLLLWLKPLKNKAFAFTISAIVFSLIIPILSSEPTIAQASAEVQFVPPSWVAEHSKDPNLRILDVRTNPLDYIPGHIPNAVHLSALRSTRALAPRGKEGQGLCNIGIATFFVNDNTGFFELGTCKPNSYF